jgi:phosphatidylserine decarboxylase
MSAGPQDIVSPADGNVIYINRVTEEGQIVAIKNGKLSDLTEISQTNHISIPCWQIGINMTPFDVHKNCSPISGKLLLSKHISGKFHSLKDFLSLVENERHTYVIDGPGGKICVVQIASRGVRRIDSYVKEGSELKAGEWLGMIRFGSQVDVFMPDNVVVNVKVRDQIYAKKTIIASWK